MLIGLFQLLAGLAILIAGGIPVPIYPPARPSQLEEHLRRHVGILNNARAVLEALRGQVSGFRRTPKYNLAGGESIASRRYRIRINRDTWIELGLAGYFLVAIAAAMMAAKAGK